MNKTETASFVYMNVAFILIALWVWAWFLFALFFRSVKITTITRIHHTMSSYCCSLSELGQCISNTEFSLHKGKRLSDSVTFEGLQPTSNPEPPVGVEPITYETFAQMEFRRLLIVGASGIIGLNLASLHVQEFNYRTQHDTEHVIVLQVVACFFLALFGVFPTDGGSSRKGLFYGYFMHWELWLPASVSTCIHSISGLFFVFTFTITNDIYTWQIWIKPNSSFSPLFIFWNGMSSVTLIIFILSRAAIAIITCVSKFNPKHNTFHELLSITSFFLESLVVMLITIGATLGTMKRNNNIHWFK